MAEELDEAIFGAFGGGFMDDVEAFFGTGEGDVEKAFLVVEDDVFGFAEKAIEVGVGVDAGDNALVGFE